MLVRLPGWIMARSEPTHHLCTSGTGVIVRAIALFNGLRRTKNGNCETDFKGNVLPVGVSSGLPRCSGSHPLAVLTAVTHLSSLPIVHFDQTSLAP